MNLGRPSRRDVLRAGSFALGSTLLPRIGWSRPATEIVAYFSDTHVTPSNNGKEFRAMVDEIAPLAPVLAINGGDVTDYGRESEFRTYVSLLEGYKFPFVAIPGNHDVRWSPLGPVAFGRYCGPLHRHIEAAGMHFFLLDSTIPLSHYGHFEASQLEWLHAELTKLGPNAPAVLATHHWVGRDQVMVDNEADLLAAIRGFNVKLILTGHGHSDLWWDWGGVPCLMNKGLYQGSYVLLKRTGDEVEVVRRSNDHPGGQRLANLNLKPEPVRKAAFSMGGFTVSGQVHVVGADDQCQYRWNGGAWNPVTDRGFVPGPRVPGSNQLVVRRDSPAAWAAIAVEGPYGLDKRWETRLGAGVLSHVALHGDQALVTTTKGELIGVNLKSGKIAHRATIGVGAVASPAASAKQVACGALDGSLLVVARGDFKPVWRTKLAGPIYSTPVWCGESLAVACGDGTIRRFDRAGKQIWTFELPRSESGFVQSALATDGTRIFAGAWDRTLYAVNLATGKLDWKAQTTEKSFAYSAAIAAPTVHEGLVIIAANGNEMMAFDRETGVKKWSATTPADKFGYSSPLVVGDRVIAGCLGDKGEVRALDVATGKELWCCATGLTIYDSSPCSNGVVAAVGSVDSTLNVIDVKSGTLVAQERLPYGHFLSSPAMDAESIVAGTLSGVLTSYALEAKFRAHL